MSKEGAQYCGRLLRWEEVGDCVYALCQLPCVGLEVSFPDLILQRVKMVGTHSQAHTGEHCI